MTKDDEDDNHEDDDNEYEDDDKNFRFVKRSSAEQRWLCKNFTAGRNFTKTSRLKFH